MYKVMNKNKTKTGNVLNLFPQEERKRIEKAYISVLEETKKHGFKDSGLIWRAYNFALQRHGTARRKTDEPYIMHPLSVAKILAENGYDSIMVAAALLHDVMEDCHVSLGELEQKFGAEIADTVNAVTNVNAFLAPDPEISANDLNDLSDIKFLTETLKNHNKRAIYTRLQPEDMIEIISEHNKDDLSKDIPHAMVRWFEYLHTREAVKSLSKWLERNMDSAVSKMTVLDFAFAVDPQIGLHPQKAYINKSTIPAEFDRVLNPNDCVRREYNLSDKKTPEFQWLNIVRTKHAKNVLELKKNIPDDSSIYVKITLKEDGTLFIEGEEPERLTAIRAIVK